MEQEEQVEGLKKELKKETMKSSISILLGLVISPISIFLTIWLTSVLAAPDIKIIDTNIRPVFNDVELKSNHLEYLKNDSYIISIIQTYLDYGSSLDIALAKLKLSTARKLYHQSESIIDKLALPLIEWVTILSCHPIRIKI